ncbi:hypothetical protein [Roseovarius sp. EL26]|uniref:hypothetical protein n=1 Tax=Roseovarius sp. EL26 TaxID=2126672 RepID=UPI000EA09993|nr:hypothetical protein [Roseovarius sp. EL26]
MSTHIDKTEDDFLDACFASVRKTSVTAPDDLMAKTLADAGSVQTEFLSQDAVTPTPAKAGLLARLLDGLGGWPAMAGLATASITGVWIGISAPAGLESVTQVLLGSDTMTHVVDLSYEAEFELAGEL